MASLGYIVLEPLLSKGEGLLLLDSTTRDETVDDGIDELSLLLVRGAHISTQINAQKSEVSFTFAIRIFCFSHRAASF